MRSGRALASALLGPDAAWLQRCEYHASVASPVRTEQAQQRPDTCATTVRRADGGGVNALLERDELGAVLGDAECEAARLAVVPVIPNVHNSENDALTRPSSRAP